MKIRVLSLFALLFAVNTYAQKIYFCSSYTSSGEPVGTSSEWTIPTTGASLYFVYQTAGSNISDSKIYFNVDKLSGGDYAPLDVVSVTPDYTKSWTSYYYKFMTEG